MFKNRNKLENHRLTSTSNNIENHEKSSLNLKKILIITAILIYRLENISRPLGKGSTRCENIRVITFGLGSG